MILRIEDTDVERSETRFEDQLIADLKWMGLDWDEGPDVGGPDAPYRQTDRLEIYREHAERLLSERKAYLCFCKEEDLQKERDQAMAQSGQAIYSGKCRSLDPADANARRAAGEPGAIRLLIPDHPIRFHDIVHGDVEFSNEVVSDPIILRSNGMPVYNYVVVIDDGLMKITHVIRGDDHLSNTPKQVALYEALGWSVPEFAHLSTILGADRERLSKRHGATSIANFRDMGVLPEALTNYLALLGWAPTGGAREIFSLQELAKEFSLERITPSAAVFDMEKLYWLNRHYIKTWPLDQLIAIGVWFFVKAGLIEATDAEWLSSHRVPIVQVASDLRGWLGQVVGLLTPYVDRLEQLPERASPIFGYDAKAALASPDNAEVLTWPHSGAVFTRFAGKILEDESAQAGKLTAEQFNKIVGEVKAETGAKGKELFHPIRIVVMGSHSGPAFDKLIPILEEGSHFRLPKHVLSVRERVEEFGKALAK